MAMSLTIGGALSFKDLEHDASASAAVVAAGLISSARLSLKLDSVHTEYSAQYLMNNACPKEGGIDTKLTVKDCLKYALKKGIPKAEDWPHLGSLLKPPSSYKPALVSSKGEVIEAKAMEEADDSLWDVPVGAKLHVYTPQIDLQQDGTYSGPSVVRGDYVGLRDGIIVGVEKIQGKSIATVKLWYKNKFQLVKVPMDKKFAHATLDGGFLNFSQGIEPTFLLSDFCPCAYLSSKRSYPKFI